MRRPSFVKARPGRETSQTYAIPAPIGGLNKRDSTANLPETDATIMDNWFPETGDVRVRGGAENHVTSIASATETLMVYNKPDGTQTMFACAGAAIYDVTSAGSVGSAVVSGQSNGRYQHVNLTTSGGTSYLCAFNGEDSPQYWDGSSWITITGVSTPAITGITTSEIIHAFVFKRRMYLILVDSLDVYYLPVDGVGGAAQKIPLGGIAYKGGYVMAGETWTLDAGEGADDYWAVITSEGQVVVYLGTDPSSSSTWQLHGVWNIGNPIGRRCMIKKDGDLLILTINGIIPLSALVVSGQTDPNVAITNKIEGAISDAGSAYRSNFGWQMVYYAQADMILLNIPVNEGSDQIQYAMNTITGSWGGPFTGIEANCWAVFNEELYFGMSDKVAKFWEARDDFGADIVSDLKQAENYYGSPGRLKYFKSIRPVLLTNGTPSLGVNMNVDFSDNPVEIVPSFIPLTVAVWDVATWDNAVWGSDLTISKQWKTTGAVGTSGAVRIRTRAAGIEVRLQSTDHIYEYGGVLG